MKITFLGAAKTVTGSCYLIETNKTKLLVDCGMFQGYLVEESLNRDPFPFDVNEIDFVLLTHAHIDHSGRLPKLYKAGYRGEIISTKATAELCEIMLPDSGHIQETDAELMNRKRNRAGKKVLLPIYTKEDAIECTKLFRKIPYYRKTVLNKEVTVKFNDAGHILGSAILEIWIKDESKQTKVVFSGDLGNKNMPIIRDPAKIESADYLIMESTYGNRLHLDTADKVERFMKIVTETIDRGGNVIIPSFAVGRTQEIIYDLNKHVGKYHKELKRIFDVPVFVDSPLATSATQVFRNNLDCYDAEARAYIANGDNPLDFPGLRFTKTVDESKALNFREDSVIIISASGMCEAGRIKHHLKHNLWKPEATVLFIGYQAEGTLGRRIADGAKKVNIYGEEISVKAQIETIDGFSGHADKTGLLEWLGSFKQKPRKVFLVHGDADSLDSLSMSIKEEYSIDTEIPELGDLFEITPLETTEVVIREQHINSDRKHDLMNKIDGLSLEFISLSETIKENLAKTSDASDLDKITAAINKIKSAFVEAAK
ncbi:MAG: MBL fold metallo-hydrolase [Eubacteriales bacterium]|nr:MBL fold metallo-hydrolase [Eubacteriales bacterium]